MKFVALYGGSFNPSTEAHRAVGQSLYKQLPVHEVWYLVSPQNPHKPKNGMADFRHRIAMAKLNLEGTTGLVVKDIESVYAAKMPGGVIHTADTLRNLNRDFANHRFIWTMGADNFATFHTWKGGRDISDHYPIAIIPRKGYTETALASPSAAFLTRLDSVADMKTDNGWYMLTGESSDINATVCRQELEQGKTPQFVRPEVARYALSNNVYGPR